MYICRMFGIISCYLLLNQFVQTIYFQQKSRKLFEKEIAKKYSVQLNFEIKKSLISS